MIERIIINLILSPLWAVALMMNLRSGFNERIHERAI